MWITKLGQMIPLFELQLEKMEQENVEWFKLQRCMCNVQVRIRIFILHVIHRFCVDIKGSHFIEEKYFSTNSKDTSCSSA